MSYHIISYQIILYSPLETALKRLLDLRQKAFSLKLFLRSKRAQSARLRCALARRPDFGRRSLRPLKGLSKAFRKPLSTYSVLADDIFGLDLRQGLRRVVDLAIRVQGVEVAGVLSDVVHLREAPLVLADPKELHRPLERTFYIKLKSFSSESIRCFMSSKSPVEESS